MLIIVYEIGRLESHTRKTIKPFFKLYFFITFVHPITYLIHKMNRTIRTTAKLCTLAAFLILGGNASSHAQSILQNVYGRTHSSLNGKWQSIVDPFDAGYYNYRMKPDANGYFKNRQNKDKTTLLEYDFSDMETLNVPGDWNTQDDRFFFYEGSMWYKKDFIYKKDTAKKLYLYFGAANYKTNVYLNGKLVGKHEGGFTPFNFDITDKVKEGNNFVVVRVNNIRKKEYVPTTNSDWWNYGGITRDVLLVETPVVSVDDYLVQLTKDSYKEISGYIQLNQKKVGVQVDLQIPELKIKKQLVTDAEGKATFKIKAKPELWSPSSPKLYDVCIANGEEILKDKIGFRQIATKGQQVLLNGKPVFLSGICIHEEAPFRQGRVSNEAECRTLLTWAKELGCNFVRLAHYPHSEAMVRAAEEMGLMVWSEIPVYWTIAWNNPATYTNASNQLKENMNRDKNRCGVVVWSLSNETPRLEARDKFLIKLAKQARKDDNTRLLSMAMQMTDAGTHTVKLNDNLKDYVDILSFNHYLGWYAGLPESCEKEQWILPKDKPFFVSEFGGGALYGKHGDKLTRWSEEYQADVYKQNLKMYNRVPGFAGCSPWILVDFLSARRRLHGIQDFFNRKGLISGEGQKKQAFYVLKDFYKMKQETYK